MPDANLENTPNSAMMKEVGRVHAEKKGLKTETEELPAGSSPVTASAETPVGEEETPEETSAPAEGDAAPGGGEPAVEEEPIRINGQTFKTQAEAFAYAEQIAREKELTDAHAQGVREALEASRQPTQPAAEPEDDFEQRFYTDPKGTLKQVQQKARDEAVALIRQEQQKEKLWSEFLQENPDIRRVDAERILTENMDTIGRLTDFSAAKKQLAQKVRSYYDEIIEIRKPRTVMENKRPALSPSGGGSPGVTPQKKAETPLSMTQQLRTLRKS